MKLYSLDVCAIGPFPGEHHVDFEALGRSGLFLLEGATGAGKSTLIDAVVFALYGQLAGQESSKQRLYSHHAEAGVEPYVDLVFEVEAGLFRIRRTPSFERPKKRGDGVRTVNESVTLMRLTDIDRPDHGVVVSTRAQEVGDEILHLIGLRRDQFLQTVVLPQGEFATFLRAVGEERKKLLQTIFRTDLYEAVTRELVERRKLAAARTAGARQAVTSARDVLARVADLDAATVDPEALLAEATADSARSEQVVESAKTALAEADQAQRVGERLAQALRRRAHLLARLADLDARRADIERAAERADLARRAGQVIALVRAERRCEAALGDSEHEHASAVALAPRGLAPTAYAEHVDALTDSIRKLTELTRVEASVPEQVRVIEGLEQHRLEIEAQSIELERRRAARPLHRATLVEQRDVLLTQLAERGALEAAVTEAESRFAAAVEVAEAESQVRQAQDLVKSLAGDATTAVHLHQELQLARIRGMAGELAEALVVGEACAVCGSQSHPHPAVRSADHPGADAVEAAGVRAARAGDALAEARAALDVATQQIEFWRRRAGGLTREQATRALDAAAADLDRLDDVANREREIVQALDRLEADAALDDDERSRLHADAATARERQTHAERSLEADRRRIAEALDGRDASLTDLVAQLEAERAAVRRLADAALAVQGARTRLAEAREQLVEGLTAHEFTDPAEVVAATLSAADLERLQHSIDAHRQEQALVDEGLADPEIAALSSDEEPPDLDALRDRRAAAADAHEAAVGLAGVAARRRDQVADAVGSLRAAERALDEADAEAAAVTRLAGLADGTSPQNLKHLTLGTYVLLRRFADVVDAANRRLGPMSDGRYHLRVSDERERSASGRRTGLALAVVDTDTGREREPRTLSGGETFYVSLCLALGLADVVSAESGGVRLGTLFVDEGFGSLDPQTLDAVMTQLSGLAQGGRTVGIVSHVEELKQRVADRIAVRRRHDGSSTLSVLAG